MRCLPRDWPSHVCVAPGRNRLESLASRGLLTDEVVSCANAVPCHVSRRFASRAVKRAIDDIEDQAVAQELQTVRPRIAAYNEVALLCERAGELPPDPKIDHLERRLDRAIRKFDEKANKGST